MEYIKINNTDFHVKSVLFHKTKEAWLEWAAPRHFEGYNLTTRRKFLTEAWNMAVNLQKASSNQQPTTNDIQSTITGGIAQERKKGTEKVQSGSGEAG